MRLSSLAIIAISAFAAVALGQGLDPVQQLTMPGGKGRHAYDPFAPPQVSGLPGVRGKAQPGREVKSPEIKWAETTTVPLRTHGSGAAGAAGPVQAKQGRSMAPAGVAGALQVLRAGDHGEFVAGELIVKLKDDVKVNGAVITRGASTATPALERVLQQAGAQGKLEPVFKNAKHPVKGARSAATGRPEPDLTRWYKLSGIDASTPMTSITEELDQNDAVAWYEPNYVRRPAVEGLPTSATDAMITEQWHLDAARVPEAWAYLESKGINPGGSRDVVVAVIDTGIDYNHPDLAANMWTNPGEIPGNGIDDDNNGYVDDVYGINAVANNGNPMDDHGHGTHVAGIIAAQAGNGGVVGIAYNSRVMAIKSAQYSGILTVSDVVQGINYAVSQGVDVINMSYGGYSRSQLEEDALAVAFSQAVLVAAAGNDGRSNEAICDPMKAAPMYPASYNWVLGIIAENHTPDVLGNYMASFSNWDCTSTNTVEYELMAPGVDVLSTLPNGQYAVWDGTSMAAPVVSGAAALIRSSFSDKNLQNSRFIMGQLASTGDIKRARTDASGGIWSYKSANCFASLSAVPKPSLSYVESWIFDAPELAPANDGDGIVDAGETVDVAIVVRNHWGAAGDVSVNLRAWNGVSATDDPYTSVTISNVNYGNIGSFSSDDNGLVTELDGTIIGVSQPFRVHVDASAPNDYVIPFHIGLNYKNALDPDDAEGYVGNGGFELVVQKGRELPQFIDQSTTLTNEHYWIIAKPTMVATGCILKIEPGTQLQFGTQSVQDPQNLDAEAYLWVNDGGELNAEGSELLPVQFIVPNQVAGAKVRILNYGESSLTYCKIQNPWLGKQKESGETVPLNSVVHCAFFMNSSYYKKWEDPTWVVYANLTSHSYFSKMVRGYYSGEYIGNLVKSGDTLLFDNPAKELSGNDDYVPTKNPGLVLSIGGLNGMSSLTNSVILCKADNRNVIKFQAPGVFENNAIMPFYSNNAAINFPMLFSVGPSEKVIGSNYFSTTSSELINLSIWDFFDDFTLGKINYTDILLSPPMSAYPLSFDVLISTESAGNITRVGAEHTTFTVKYNRDMDPTVQPRVTFGPADPMTDFIIQPIDGPNGGWVDPRTWQGTFTFTPITGDGYQYLRIVGGRAADDHWLVCGDDMGRHRFEIITAGTEAMRLQANGGEGKIDLTWQQNDYDLVAGYNLYRSTTSGGTYTRLNTAVIPPQTVAYSDTTVAPGQTYYYKFTVVKTDFTESEASNVASSAAVDTILPVINHVPVTYSVAAQARALQATVTDNVSVAGVTLHYRTAEGQPWQTVAMVKNSANSTWSGSISSSAMTAPGVHYYISATDGVGTAFAGTASTPFFIQITDNAVVNTVSPASGPATGGTTVTISGSNFKAGATVEFGGALAGNVTISSANQITAVTPPHFPATVNVAVSNPDGDPTVKAGAFTFLGSGVSLSVPAISGDTQRDVEIPVNLGGVSGLMAAQFGFTYDTAVLQFKSIRNGELTSGFQLQENHVTAGTVNVGLAGTTAVSGTGVVTYITFTVIGGEGATTALNLTNVQINDGAISPEISAGQLTVRQLHDISGTVTYYAGGASVDGVNLSLQSPTQLLSSTSAVSGSYSFDGLYTDEYTLTPSKSDGTDAVTAYDASLVLQAAVGNRTLTLGELLAADVNNNSDVTALDASYILQHAVNLITLPFNGRNNIWAFNPPSRSYSPLDSDRTGQNFVSTLIGDVSGNFGTGSTIGSTGEKAALAIGSGAVQPGAEVTVPITFTPSNSDVLAVTMQLTYDNALLELSDVTAGTSVTNALIASNTATPGTATIAVALPEILENEGDLLKMVFTAKPGTGGTSNVTITATANEGSPELNLTNGQIRVGEDATVSEWSLF